MFRLESPRLYLIPLSLEQLILLVSGRRALELSMGLTPGNFELNTTDTFLINFGEVVLSYILPDVEKNPEDYLWFTHWLIIDKHLNLTVGGIGVNGVPDENGELLLGYFVDKKFENRGIATEAVTSFSQFLFKNDSLKFILADTLINSIGSQKVLQKSGFTFREENEEGLRWELKKD